MRHLSQMDHQRSERLTRREREIMNAVFALGNRASAAEIRSRLTTPPSDSSIRVMLARLEKKGFLRHHQDASPNGPRCSSTSRRSSPDR
jgi:predicted transcriptional regulator